MTSDSPRSSEVMNDGHRNGVERYMFFFPLCVCVEGHVGRSDYDSRHQSEMLLARKRVDLMGPEQNMFSRR